jgi:hypothetical protein
MRWQEFMSLEHRRLDERREGKLRRALGDPLPGETKEQLERIGERDRLMAHHGLVALVGGGTGGYLLEERSMVFVFEADSEEEEQEMLEDLPLSGAAKLEVRRMRALGELRSLQEP